MWCLLWTFQILLHASVTAMALDPGHIPTLGSSEAIEHYCSSRQAAQSPHRQCPYTPANDSLLDTYDNGVCHQQISHSQRRRSMCHLHSSQPLSTHECRALLQHQAGMLAGKERNHTSLQHFDVRRELGKQS